MEFQPTKGIYLQIAENICEKILNQSFKAGEKIPSVRELASETGVNPNTIVRTYSELQTQGIIENRRGVGFFVTAEANRTIHSNRKQAFFKNFLPELISNATLLGISIQDIKDHLDQMESTF